MKKIVLLIICSLTFCQTGFLTKKDVSAFGLFISINKNIEHTFYDPISEFSFSYIPPFPLEFGISYIQNKNEWNQENFNITYHFKGNSSIINSFIKYNTGKKNYKLISDNLPSENPEYLSHFSVGFYTGHNFYCSITHGISEIENPDDDDERIEESFFSLGKYFKVESLVVGIKYTAFKELREEGYLGITLGTVF